MLIVNRRGGTCQVIDLIYLNIEREGDVVAHQLKMWIIQQVRNVVFRASKEIVDADDIVTLGKQTLAKVRAKKAGATGNECAGSVRIVFQVNAPIKRLIPFRPSSIRRLVNEKLRRRNLHSPDGCKSTPIKRPRNNVSGL